MLTKIERKVMEGRGCWCAVRYTCTNAVATILDRVGAVVSSLGDLSSDLPSLYLSLSSDQFRSSSEARLT